METGKQRPYRPPDKRSKTYREICPVEIKSSGYNSHKSLDRFHEKYSGRILQRYPQKTSKRTRTFFASLRICRQ